MEPPCSSLRAQCSRLLAQRPLSNPHLVPPWCRQYLSPKHTSLTFRLWSTEDSILPQLKKTSNENQKPWDWKPAISISQKKKKKKPKNKKPTNISNNIKNNLKNLTQPYFICSGWMNDFFKNPSSIYWSPPAPKTHTHTHTHTHTPSLIPSW